MIALALVTLLSSSPLSLAEQKAASVDGKYEKLLRVLTVEEDRERYGDFRDYGWWTETAYLGHENIAPGYWVYVAPRWYVWKTRRPMTDPSFGGRYAKLVATVDVPEDEERYGQSTDQGWWDGTEYHGATDLPPAYWTYVAPRWYLWRARNSP